MRIICMGDAHFTSMKWRSEVMRKINRRFYTEMFRLFFAQEGDLYLSLGDLTHFGTLREYRDIYRIIHQTKKPDQRFVQVVGNHDLLTIGKDRYQKLTGQALYWKEEQDNLVLLFLDTCRALHPGKKSGRMNLQQVAFIQDSLREAKDRFVLIFAHHPPQRVEIMDDLGNPIPNRTLEDVLQERQQGRGLYINGHLHKDRFEAIDRWGRIQFNDILDEPTVRILEILEGRVTMETQSLSSPKYQWFSQQIAQGILTFKRTMNDEEFAKIRDLEFGMTEGDRFRVDPVRVTRHPYYSLKKKK